MRLAIESIQRQTYQNYEFLIVDDGSTEQKTIEILRSFHDPRIVIYQNKKNIGLTNSLIKGIELSRGAFIARFDADDIALPHRLEKQVAYFLDHPEIGLLGSACFYIDGSGRFLGRQNVPESDLEIRWHSLFANPFIHSSVMIRRSVLVNGNFNYDPECKTAQDYDFWVRLLPTVRASNLPQALIYYRIHDASISSVLSEEQVDTHLRVAFNGLKQTFPTLDLDKGLLQSLILEVANIRNLQSRKYWRTDLAILYLELWDIFKIEHLHNNSISRLQKKIVYEVATMILYPPITRGVLKVLLRITRIDVTWPLFFIKSVPGSILGRVRTVFFRNRKS